jgi:hypothetical protein
VALFYDKVQLDTGMQQWNRRCFLQRRLYRLRICRQLLFVIVNQGSLKLETIAIKANALMLTWYDKKSTPFLLWINVGLWPNASMLSRGQTCRDAAVLQDMHAFTVLSRTRIRR